MHSKTIHAQFVELVVSQGHSLGLWNKLQSYARSNIFATFDKGLLVGQLIIKDDKGEHSFGKPTEGSIPVTMTVYDDNLWARIAISADLGFSEGYMAQEFDTSDLRGLLQLWIENRATLQGLSTTMATIASYLSAFVIRKLGRQSLAMSRANVEVAYDTSNDFFKCFLGKEMMYSCALWGDAEDGLDGDLMVGPTDGDLEAAQQRKIHHVLKLARVRPGDRLLEIGSGWGAMSIAAARLGCFVDTVTLSHEQKAETEARASAAGLASQIHVHLCDYRELPQSFEHAFDSFVSCEMIEAVGLDHHAEYFRMIDWALKKDRGSAVITATAQPDFRYQENQPDDFGRHYHWPNTFLPNATWLPVHMQNAVKGRMVLFRLEDHGHHYSRTLREWGRRFEQNFAGDVLTEMQKKYPELQKPKALEAFKRKWRYLFAYAEIGFVHAYTSVNCWAFSRPCNPYDQCD